MGKSKPTVDDAQLRVEYVPLPEIEGWPRNPKTHDDATLADSITRFGFNDPVAVDEGTGRLVEGHGRVDALRQMKTSGAAPPERVRVGTDGEWYVPVLRGLTFRSESEARAYLLAHNRLTETGGWDDVRLHEMLTDLQAQADVALVGVGFDQDDINRLALAAMAAAASATGVPVPDHLGEWAGMPEFEQEEKLGWRSVVVRFKDQAAVEQFEAALGVRLGKQRHLWYPEPDEAVEPEDGRVWAGTAGVDDEP